MKNQTTAITSTTLLYYVGKIPEYGTVNKLTPNMIDHIEAGKEETTYLVCKTALKQDEAAATPNASASSEKKFIYRNRDGKHAEKEMLTDLSSKGYQLPTEIYITRSPCESCAVELLKAYSSMETKPTIYVAGIFMGNEKQYITNHHIQGLVELKRNGFSLEVWDDDTIKLDTKKRSNIEDMLTKCTQELDFFKVSTFPESTSGVVCQLPLQYAEATPTIPHSCIVLTFVYNNFLGDVSYGWPVVVIKRTGKPITVVHNTVYSILDILTMLFLGS